jgi:hypothetical protein
MIIEKRRLRGCAHFSSIYPYILSQQKENFKSFCKKSFPFFNFFEKDQIVVPEEYALCAVCPHLAVFASFKGGDEVKKLL